MQAFINDDINQSEISALIDSHTYTDLKKIYQVLGDKHNKNTIDMKLVEMYENNMIHLKKSGVPYDDSNTLITTHGIFSQIKKNNNRIKEKKKYHITK